MKQFYQKEARHLVSVDCIILGFKEDTIYVLVINRKVEPLKGGRSLMGGFVHEKESLDEAVLRVVFEYTGVEDVYMEQVGAYGDVNRDIGGRVISVVYYALINMELFDKKLEKKHSAQWVDVTDSGPLILDHSRFLNDTLQLMRLHAATRPVGFNLLPKKFTLPQLQSLYEAIWQRPLDKRNFRKKIQDMKILKKLDEKDKQSSKRGAYYYKFDKAKYDRLLKDGFYFSL